MTTGDALVLTVGLGFLTMPIWLPFALALRVMSCGG